MKKHVVIAAGLAVLSTSAYATKARIGALGGDERGSYYIQDTRNVFRNAANVNDMTNYIVTEWGDQTGTGASPEGGIFRSAGSLNYGIYLGSEIDNNGGRVVNNGTDDVTFMDQSNRLQVFVGGDAGLKWGATAYYASNKDETGADDGGEMKNTAFGVGLGVISGAIEGWANVLISDKSEGSADSTGTPSTGLAADKWEADLGFNVGAAYNWMDYKFYAEYTKGGAEATAAGAKSESDNSQIVVGVGHTHEVAATSRIFTSVQYENGKVETKPAGGAAAETKTQALPLTIGFETDATSWLALRGSISQNIVIGSTEVGGKSASQQNSTEVNAGATLNFGKLKVDGMIGVGTGATPGSLHTDELLTQVGVHYWF